MLPCYSKSITLPKIGNSKEENEDRILEPSESEMKSDPIVRFAISDGATESSFSRRWAELLVNAYKSESFDKEHLSETVKAISKTWQSEIKLIELPWYAQQKAEKGAFATFLGLTIDRKKNSFEAVAVGDCILFQIREGELLRSFPRIKGFNNTPNLIASVEKYQTDLGKNVIYRPGNIQSKDIILLSTDAFAAWILKETNLGRKKLKKGWRGDDLFKRLEEKNKIKFEKWLNKQRKENKIKNDDVSLLIIKFE